MADTSTRHMNDKMDEQMSQESEPTTQDTDCKNVWTAAELLAGEWPEPKWIVPGVISVGLSVLAGRPKTGKSWLALLIGLAVSTGGKALERDVEQRKVLYIALEDSARRLQHRCKALGMPESADITFVTEWPSLDRKDGVDSLEQWISRKKCEMVIIDTIGRAAGKADQLDLAEMNGLMGRVQEMAHAHEAAIVVIDHHTKPRPTSGDPVDDVIGSTGKSAVCDTILGLYRKHGKRYATLKARGRDIEDKEFCLEFDNETCIWKVISEDGRRVPTSKEKQVLEAVEALLASGELPTTSRIAERLGKNKGNVSRILGNLTEKGYLSKGARVGREVPYVLAES